MKKDISGDKNQFLQWADLIIITVIMFGWAIFYSMLGFYEITYQGGNIEDLTTFTSSQNWERFSLQSIILIIVFCYLKLRKFDFYQWNIIWSLRSVGKGILLFIIAASIIDIFGMLYVDEYKALSSDELSIFQEWWKNFNFSIIPYALLNGFYEEIFFLGICLAVKPKSLPYALAFSLIVRFSFHTYQGIDAAINIGFLFGTTLYFAYTKWLNKNLLPCFLAHSIADIFGLSFIGYIIY